MVHYVSAVVRIFLISSALFISLASAQVEGSSSKTYGIILSGGAEETSNHYRYYDNSVSLYKAFVQNGVSKKDIYTFYGSGASGKLDTRKKGVLNKDFMKNKPDLLFSAAQEFKKNEVNVNGPAEISQLKKAFIDISKKAKPGDVISFFITDHGSSDGSVVMWGLEDKPDHLKTADDKKWEKENKGAKTQQSKKMSMTDMKELLKLVPPGVTVQIANNICYGGSMVQLTDPEAGICVVSQVDDKRPSVSELDSSPFARGYIQSLGVKSFEAAYADAKDEDYNTKNVGSQNSLDYFVNNELAKKPSQSKSGSALVCPSGKNNLNEVKTAGSQLSDQSTRLSLQMNIEQEEKKLKKIKATFDSYLQGDYAKQKSELSSSHQKTFNMKLGPERDTAYAERAKKSDKIELEKLKFENRIENVRERIKSLKKQISFLDIATSEQLEKYNKIKKCMERSI